MITVADVIYGDELAISVCELGAVSGLSCKAA
jgi:hypothetical protein